MPDSIWSCGVDELIVDKLENVHSSLERSQGKAIEADKAADTLNAYTNLIPVNIGAVMSRRPTAVHTTIPKAKGESAIDTKKKDSAGTAPSAKPPLKDAKEEEIRRNVEGISGALGNLKQIATAMDEEIDRQNQVIDANVKVTSKTTDILKGAQKKTEKFLKS